MVTAPGADMIEGLPPNAATIDPEIDSPRLADDLALQS